MIGNTGRAVGPDRKCRERRIFRLALLAASALLLAVSPAAAQDATWNNPATVAGPVAGTFDFNANANWTNPATVPTGTAFFGTSSTTALSFSANTTIGGWTFNAGASNYTFTNGKTLRFTGAGIVINGGSTTITNNSALGFSNTSTAGNATITNNGVLNFFNTSTAGSATITNNFFLDFFNTSTGGTARFITNAGGTFDMAGLTAAGMTAGSIEGAGSYILGANALAVGSNNLSTDVSGVISGVGGSLTKTGSGALTLSGANTYTGNTTVNGGSLLVNGSTATSALTTVNAGGTLGGSGTVGNTAITGGTLAPGSVAGNVFGPLTVQGTLSLTAASTYMIQVSPANAGRTNVTGTATLGGASVNAMFAPGSYINRQYTIVNASGGVIGTFNPAVISNMPNIQSTLSYDTNDAFLNIKLLFQVPPSGLNINQQNVANALTNFFNRNGGIPAAFALLGPGGLTQASGETATGAQQTTFDAMNQFMGLLTDPFIAGRGDGVTTPTGPSPYAEVESARGYATSGKVNSNRERDAYAAVYRKAPPAIDPFAQRWSVWAAGYGGSQTTDGNAALGSNTATSRVFGAAVGADYRFSPDTLAGFALAGGGTNFSIANGLGTGRSDLFQAGAFVRHTVGPAYFSAALAYGWQDITTDRTLTIAGIDQLRAKFNANAFSGRVEGGYRFVTPWMGVTPYAAGQFTTFDLPAYAEQAIGGANTFALAYAAKEVTASRSELGLRTDKSWAMQDSILTLRGRFAWAHDFNTDRNIAATFQALPGASFVVNGAAQARDAALTTASAEMKWLNGFSLAATFEGEFSDVTRSYAGKGVVRYAW